MAPLTPAIAAATVRLDAFFTRLAAREPSEPQRGGNGSSGEGDDGDALIPSEDVEEALGTLACLIHQRRDKLLPLLPAAIASSVVDAAADVSAALRTEAAAAAATRSRATTATVATASTAAGAMLPTAKRRVRRVFFSERRDAFAATTMAAASAAAVAEAATRARAAASRAFPAVSVGAGRQLRQRCRLSTGAGEASSTTRDRSPSSHPRWIGSAEGRLVAKADPPSTQPQPESRGLVFSSPR